MKYAANFSSALIADDMADVEWEKFQSSVLIEVKRGEEIFTSSAVAIARNVLLTCAHSVADIEDGRVFWDPQYRPESKKFIKFKKVVLHPGYNSRRSNFRHDLALVVLRATLPSRIRPAKIHSEAGTVKKGMQAHRLGFGARDGANIRTWTNPEVLKYDKASSTFTLLDRHGQIGDSGGPLFIKTRGHYKLFGLHSTKEGENLAYSVSVSDHLEWINDNIND